MNTRSQSSALVDAHPSPDLESMSFGHLEIAFDRRVLRPRPWTIEQAHWAADLLEQVPEGPVLEMFCGVGHIGLLAIADTQRALVSIDVDPVAAAFAAHNAAAAGLCSRVEVRRANVEVALRPDERFPLIIADPPWVPRFEVAGFPEDPPLAIDGGGDGMEVTRVCLTVAERNLSVGGVVVLQVGSIAQVARISDFLCAGPLRVSETRNFPGQGVLVRLDRVDGSCDRPS